jgi:3-dehydroquinate synthase
MSTTIRAKNYQIFLGNDTFYQIGKFVSRNLRQPDSKKVILVDSNTRTHCLPLLQWNVLPLQNVPVLEIPAGEESKSIHVVTRLWNEMTALGMDRSSILLNLGGGVVTDVGGFAASTYMRGIDFINIPTTLLAMVDASVGGKNGINFAGFKNQIGTFDEPQAVFVSPVFIKSLPEAEIRSGFAEVIKHALISDIHKWDAVKSLGSLENVNWFEIIRESIWTKNKIVNSDYRDRHIRKALNFGHTVGHALESYSAAHHATPLKHGEAIAVGMICETYLSTHFCGLDPLQASEIYQVIRKHYRQPVDFNNEEVLQIMKGDKKNQSEKINFSLIRNIGDPLININAEESLILQALEFSKERLMEMS